MKQKQLLEIILPESLSDLPVRIVRGPVCSELVLSLTVPEAVLKPEPVSADGSEQKYAFIWRQNDYLKVALDEILWIEADKSYSIIHLTGKRELTVSFNIAVIRKKLPETGFIRIHRSHIVNLRHVESLMGNSLKIGNMWLTIGREYRDIVFGRFVFLGVRKSGK